jgi:DNA-binding transcriptional MerR regulator
MADSETSRRVDRESNAGKLYTLSEVAKRTGISMPTLQRYKKLYQSRIPSVGKGRKQRYPDSALPVFDQIKKENLGKRGRPRKDAAAGRGRRGRKAAAAPAVVAKPAAGSARGKRGAPARRGRPPGSGSGGRRRTAGGLLTLTQISKTTGISYPTLVRYVKLFSDRLPHEGTGRTRRFHPEAVEAFRQLRQESGRGGRKKGSGGGVIAAGRAAIGAAGAAVTGRLKALEESQKQLEKKFRGLIKSLQELLK